MKFFLIFAGLAAIGNAQSPSFEAADVHTTAPGWFLQGGTLHGGLYQIKNATMVDLILMAYGTDADVVVGMPMRVNRKRWDKVNGGPTWIDYDEFDINAKAPPGATPATAKLMLQALLADRFKLAVHMGKGQTSNYVLTAGPHPKLKEADGTEPTGCNVKPPSQDREAIPFVEISCHNFTMDALAAFLRVRSGDYFLGRPVLDQTGLDAKWNFDLKYSARSTLPMAGSLGIPLAEALDKQLGLKLEMVQLPTDVILVDHVNQKPTENSPEEMKKLPAVRPEFEVANVKLTDPAFQGGRFQLQPGGRVSIQGIPLKTLIAIAWDIATPDMMVAAPKFLDTARVDIIAKASGDLTDIDALRPLLRSLLEDRFKIATHTDIQPVPVHVLKMGKGKPNIKKADPTARTQCMPPPPTAARTTLTSHWLCQNVTMAQLAVKLKAMAGAPGGLLDDPVVDATGLEGGWDFEVAWSPANLGTAPSGGRGGLPSEGANATDPNGRVTVPEAIERQLGLKLEIQKHPMPVLVIDHVEEKPTDN